MKYCNKCNTEKPLSEFHKRRARACGVVSTCKECKSKSEKIRYLSKRSEILNKKRSYNDANREKINTRQREYNEKNKTLRKKYAEANREEINRKRRERLANDPLFNLQDRLRRRTNYAFQIMGYTKTGKTEVLLGAPWDVVKTHIERQFKKGMSWENRGEWEIDHITPLCSAKTKEDVITLSNYINLQPLWKSENRSKSGKITKLI
jgi:Skp family chaperone for outer membrane proteins